MGARSRYSQEDIARTVERYTKGESARSLAKELHLSVPAVYLWIAKAREKTSEAGHSAVAEVEGTSASEADALQAKVKRLEDEVTRLKARLFDLLDGS
ncbi:MAG: transposase [Pseudomonadota bacterium]|nr:transposase [Pseudomonadota bacterium]